MTLDELIVGRARVEPHPQHHAQRERHERDAERQLTHKGVAVAAHHEGGHPAGERQQDERRQNAGHRHRKYPTIATTPTMSDIA